MKQVLLNLAQPQYTVHSDKSTAAGVKCQSAAAKPSVTFEQAERDDDVYTPRPPTEFVRSVTHTHTHTHIQPFPR